WHWQVLHKLGIYDVPNSYVKYLVLRLTGVDLNAGLVDTLTVLLFFIALIMSMIFNFRNRIFKSS
ncbi:MAG: hypothetical protein K8R37_00560, partial [Bacteroidales bacterium]|nr:hypothetical protein [Bacteroidales bacterium]